MISTDVLMYASDHPHRHGPSIEVLDAVLDDDARRAVRHGNAAAFYRL
jgi:predicted TIM-barrel fold metal-dependent hydrolase